MAGSATNPFIIDQNKGRRQRLAGLGQAIGARREKQEAVDAKALMQQEVSAALKSRDANALAQVSAKYPEMATAIRNSMGIQDEAASKEAKDFSLAVMTSPDNADTLYQERIAMLQTQGRDPSNTVQSHLDFLENPEQELKDVGMVYAGLASPQEYKAWQGSQEPSRANYSDIKTTETGGLMGLNKNTGQYELIQTPEKVRKGAPQVQVGAGETEEAKALGKFKGQNYADIQKGAKSANKMLASLNVLDKLSDDAFEGSFTGAKMGLSKIGGMIGIDVEGLSESEVFNAVASGLTLDSASQLSGAMSDKDIEFLQSTLPQLNTTKEGRKKIISVMKVMANIKKQYARDAAEFRREKGTFDEIEFQDWVKEKRGDKDMLSKYFEGSSSSDRISDNDLVKKYGG
jgi:hypothetical protein